ncbi:MAG: substrate-binding domain-containing protein [Oscillospiraceae bacterium]
MKKTLPSNFLRLTAIATATIMVALSLAGCGNTASSASTASASAGGSEASGTKRIAVIRNMTSSDHTAQFFAGCTEEGNALGYTVDTFMSDGNDVKMQDLMESALQQDYDIWVISHANEGYQNEMITRAKEKGISVSCFDCGGEHVEGVSYTSQNDQSLASISLDAMIEKVEADGGSLPVKFIEINTLGAIVPFDTRHAVIEQYIADGKLERVSLSSPSLTGGDTYNEIYNGVSTVLAQDKNNEIKGLWAASAGFLDAPMDAFAELGRSDIVVTSIDISDTEVQRLYNNEQYYLCAAVDPYVIGVVNVRLAVLQSMGIETPETVALDAIGVYRSQLSADDTMSSLNKYFDNFGATDLYDTDEIKALREQVAAG